MHRMFEWARTIAHSRKLGPAAIYMNRMSATEMNLSQLNLIVDQSNLFARLEGGQTDIGTSITPKCIPQRAITTTSDFPLHSEIYLR